MTTITEDEIESRVVAMFRRAWRKAHNQRANFSLRYDWRNEQHAVKLIDIELERETIITR
jgi:hypothetical protein